MFNLGMQEMILLAIIVLIFIGPKELPELARVVGRFMNDLKRASGELSSYITEDTARKFLEDKKDKVEGSDPAQAPQQSDPGQIGETAPTPESEPQFGANEATPAAEPTPSENKDKV